MGPSWANTPKPLNPKSPMKPPMLGRWARIIGPSSVA